MHTARNSIPHGTLLEAAGMMVIERVLILKTNSSITKSYCISSRQEHTIKYRSASRYSRVWGAHVDKTAQGGARFGKLLLHHRYMYNAV